MNNLFAIPSLLLLVALLGCVAQDENGGLPFAPVDSGAGAGPEAPPSEPSAPPIIAEPTPTDLVSCVISNSRVAYIGFNRWPYHSFTITYTGLGPQTANNVTTQINEPTAAGEDVVKSWDAAVIGDIGPGQVVEHNFSVNAREFRSPEMREFTAIKTTMQNGSASTCSLSVAVPA